MKWAIVTGASSGVGLEFARRLAALGYGLVLVSNQEAELRAVAAELAAGGTPSLALPLDLSAVDAAERVVAFLEEHAVTPHVLINNAGIFDFKPVGAMTPERLDLYINLHARTMTLLCRNVGALMARQGEGYILNMASMTCWMAMPGLAMYSATKAYVRAFSRALRLELEERGVGVTVACPGGISTNLFGLPPWLRRLLLGVGILVSPRAFARRALRRMFRRRAQYVNGLFNRFSIVAIHALPEWVIRPAAKMLGVRY